MSITTRSRKGAGNATKVPTPFEEEEVAVTTTVTPTAKDKTAVYALTPALVSNEPIDYGTAAGAKIYKQATEKLKTEYDLKVETIHLFLAQLEDRATAMGWSSICEVPDDGKVLRSIFTHFGQLTEENMEEHAAQYMGLEDKRKQLAVQMATCILNSLTDEALIEIRVVRAQYTINDIHHGPLMLWAIIQRATINVKASAALLRQKLWLAPEALRNKQYDVQEFNAYIGRILFQLSARGEEAPDTLVHLFRAYKSAPNAEFVQYVKHKENMYEEAEIEMTAQKLMGLATTKYNTLKEQELWDQENQAGDEIVALKAEIALLKQQNKRKPEQKKKDERFAWKEKKIAGKETLNRNNKTYHWCPYHKAYTIHKPEDCRLATKKPKIDKEGESTPMTGMTAVYDDEAGFNTFGDELVDDESE